VCWVWELAWPCWPSLAPALWHSAALALRPPEEGECCDRLLVSICSERSRKLTKAYRCIDGHVICRRWVVGLAYIHIGGDGATSARAFEIRRALQSILLYFNSRASIAAALCGLQNTCHAHKTTAVLHGWRCCVHSNTTGWLSKLLKQSGGVARSVVSPSAMCQGLAVPRLLVFAQSVPQARKGSAQSISVPIWRDRRHDPEAKT
jgi:hypothetical protein